MSRLEVLLLCSTVALLIAVTHTLPPCAVNDDICHDQRMHPELPADERPKTAKRADTLEETTEFWRALGLNIVKQKLNATPNKNKAKNVIMFLGDGMGLTTLAAARNLLGGEEQSLSFESFPYTGLSKTYSVDTIVSDSACTATAYLCGVKGMTGTIGVNGNVERDDCVTMLDTNNHVHSIAKWAMDAGKSAGVVTTTRITHASPAGVYAHIAERDWENDQQVKADCGAGTQVHDIADQLITGDIGKRLQVILGGGKKHFIDSSLYAPGKRTDGRNLIDEFKAQGAKNAYVETLEQLQGVNGSEIERVLGLFNDDHLLYHLETNEQTNQPTLEDLTRKAIELLSRNENGYFIFIEGGRIDHAHHDTLARLALDETVEFSKAIKAARDLTNENDTLIVVTADHSHAFSYSGYPYRGNDIFGTAPAKGSDGIPYLTLSYANGPSYERFYDVESHGRIDPSKVLASDIYDEFPATVPLYSETHGGDDVPVFASGPWSHLFTGVYEQNTIPHIMAYASCIGDGLISCENK